MRHICKYCEKEFETSQQLGGHTVSCYLNPKNKSTKEKRISSRASHLIYVDKDLTCPVCGHYFHIHVSQKLFDKNKYKKTCSSKCAHKLSVLKTDIEHKNNNISESIQTKFATKFNMFQLDDLIKNNIIHINICQNCGKQYKYISKCLLKYINSSIEYISPTYCCKECMEQKKREKLSENAKKYHLGGYNEYSVTGYHKGYIDGIRFDSSWELAYILYHKDNNIPIKRCEEVREYIFEGKTKKYYPDFVVNNQIIEIKGYQTEQSKAKSFQNPDILVLTQKDMGVYLNYAEQKYGKKFWKLYENNNATLV